jgi:TRAP transporter 4TM/12TM fusion protein
MVKNKQLEKEIPRAIIGRHRELHGAMKYLMYGVGMSMSCFHLYTTVFGTLSAIPQRATHLGFALILMYLLLPLSKRKGVDQLVMVKLINYGLIIITVISSLYLLLQWETVQLRVGVPNTYDIIFALLAAVLLLEGTRRAIGWPLPVICCIFIFYAYFGPYFPGMLAHKGYSLSRIVSHLYMGIEGLWGLALGVSATYVVMFIIFGSFLMESGAGDFLMDFATSIFGTFKGGPAKVAVVASALFGTVSGAAVANVATTGTVTIPLMKRTGYRPFFAGAVEAVASSGGQIMPPVMGAAAFIMAEILGIPYWSICVAAAGPALLYYLGVFASVHMEAWRTGLVGRPRSELPPIWPVLKKGLYFIIPLFVLIYMLGYQMVTPQKSAWFAIVAVFLTSLISKKNRMGPKKLVEALKNGATGTLEAAAACASTGIIVGVVSLTGLGLKMSSLLIELSHGYLPLLLVLTMIASLILGMGLTTVSCYIILAVLVAPALVEFGVTPLAAHLFVFYFGIIANITPPVATAAYVGAAIAGANPLKTGFYACLLGLSAFIIPYMFVYNPVLLLMGGLEEIILSYVTAIIGVIVLTLCTIGYFGRSLALWEKVGYLIAALLLIKPGWKTDLAGIGIILIVLVIGYRNQIHKLILERRD